MTLILHENSRVNSHIMRITEMSVNKYYFGMNDK